MGSSVKKDVLTRDTMTYSQRECYDLLVKVMKGEHHLPPVSASGETGIVAVLYGGMSTYDSDALTRLVVLCHHRCIRAEIEAAAPRYLRIYLHRRVRADSITEGHPTMEEAIRRV